MMKYLFIDSNVWLTLYHFPKNDLSEFSKIKSFLGTDITLILPRQVHDEIIRNRDAKIKDAIKDFKFQKISFPVFCKDYPEYDEIMDIQKELQKKFITLEQKIKSDINRRNLVADNTLKTFFHDVEIIPCDCYVEKAYRRYRIGNPPGKDNKYGDAINWECLLDKVPDGHDLYIIADDKDYKSAHESDKFNLFLELEWKEKKNANVHFYTKLVDFLNQHYKDIKLVVEEQKEELIQRLARSGSFLDTHYIVGMLFDYSEWNESQIEKLCYIAETNEQVSRILSDIDVLTFYSKLLGKLDYFKLQDSSTKRVMYNVFGDAIDQEIAEMERQKDREA
ncbi:MAG: DUF4935 domain-containing protein [Ruminococcus sp.]|nr:DUF4935 domain-containing protein [Ruminococcus sp.]